MKIGLLGFTSLCALGAFAADVGGHDYWSGETLDGYAAELARSVGANNSAVADRIIDHGHYFAAIVHREPGPGFSESHRDWADLYFVSSGTATLVVGGSIPDGTETAPGEIRGTSIQGGTRRTLAEGDVVHIPAGTPHHVFVDPGNQVTYFIFKATQASR
jgi:mannose-6-phosphate isomerase-like protein (cupin superfamily)